MKKKEDSGTRWRAGRVAGAAAVLALALAACTAPAQQPLMPVAVPNFGKLFGTDVTGRNYSTDSIYTFGYEGPKYSDIRGGGGPIGNVGRDGRPGGMGVSCCARLPAVWQPDLRLTVHWEVLEEGNKGVVKHWYKAENVQIPKYNGKTAGDVWGIFLPNHRVRIMVPDGVDPNGGNNPDIRPPDSDPYIAQGVRDIEFEQQLKEENQ